MDIIAEKQDGSSLIEESGYLCCIYASAVHGRAVLLALRYNRWMTYQKDIINKNKNHQSSKNKLGMEGRIPTMPNVYIRNFILLRTSGVGQAKTSWAQYISPRPVICPRCSSRTVTLYDHYFRKASFINDEGVRRVLIIKARRFKCHQCSHLFCEPIEGLLPKKRSSEQYRLAVAHEYIKNVNNKTIAREFAISPNTVERIIMNGSISRSRKP